MKTRNKETGKAEVGRRDFLKTVGLASGVAVAAATVAVKTPKAAETSESSNGAGYSETDHVRTYYDRARF